MLLLDLDETLVHCFTNDLYDHQQVVTIYQPEGNVMNVRNFRILNQIFNFFKAKLNIRPFAVQFLQSLKDIFNIVLFTASRKHYAEKILKILDPTGNLPPTSIFRFLTPLDSIFKGKLFREHCFQTQKGWHIKDIRMVADIDPSKTILVDNSASSFGVQPHNGIPIVPYFFKQDDIELIKLRNFLFAIEKLIRQGFDTRVMLKKYFKLDEYSKAKDFEVLKTVLFED